MARLDKNGTAFANSSSAPRRSDQNGYATRLAGEFAAAGRLMPKVSRHPAEFADARRPNAQHSARESAAAGRILVAGDDDGHRQLAANWLTALGCEVLIVANGREAVAAIHADENHTRFDLILMDFKMPRMDCVRATRVIRAWESAAELPRSPIVAITASDSPSVRLKCLEAGIDDILVKPLDGAALAAVLRRWLPSFGGAS